MPRAAPQPDADCVRQFGLTLRRQRERQRWSQEQLAAAAGLNRSYVGEIEPREAVASLQTAQKLARALGLPLSDLLAEMERQHDALAQRRRSLAAIAG